MCQRKKSIYIVIKQKIIPKIKYIAPFSTILYLSEKIENVSFDYYLLIILKVPIQKTFE